MENIPDTPPMPFENVFPGANPLAIDLLKQLLCYDTTVRLTAEQALAHPYFAQFHDVEDEPVAPGMFDESFEHVDLEADGWKGFSLFQFFSLKSHANHDQTCAQSWSTRRLTIMSRARQRVASKKCFLILLKKKKKKSRHSFAAA